MKIAELFVQLGFQVEGGDKLTTIDRNLGKAQMSALGLLAAVGALNAGFLLMMNRAVDAAVGLDQWQRATGQSADELQRLQYGAARANVAAKSVADAIQNILRVRSEIALGNADASSPWFMLGIDPRQDPLKVLDQLRTALAHMDPSIGRNFVQKMGFGDDILYLLQQKKSLGNIFVNQDERDKLTALGGQWKGLLFNLGTLATKFGAVFADSLSKVVGWLEKGTILMDRFVHWLNSGTVGANTMKAALVGLIALLGALGVGLTLLVGLLGVLKGLLLSIQLMPIVLAATLLVGVLALMAGAIVGLILLFQDFWTQIDGGKSFFDWNQNLIFTIKNVERLAKALEFAQSLMQRIGTGTAGLQFEMINGLPMPIGFASDFVGKPPVSGGGGVHQTNNVEIHVDGSHDPQATGREVGRSVKREVSDAYGMLPIATN